MTKKSTNEFGLLETAPMVLKGIRLVGSKVTWSKKLFLARVRIGIGPNLMSGQLIAIGSRKA
jgi:hypothetical protein